MDRMRNKQLWATTNRMKQVFLEISLQQKQRYSTFWGVSEGGCELPEETMRIHEILI